MSDNEKEFRPLTKEAKKALRQLTKFVIKDLRLPTHYHQSYEDYLVYLIGQYETALRRI